MPVPPRPVPNLCSPPHYRQTVSPGNVCQSLILDHYDLPMVLGKFNVHTIHCGKSMAVRTCQISIKHPSGGGGGGGVLAGSSQWGWRGGGGVEGGVKDRYSSYCGRKIESRPPPHPTPPPLLPSVTPASTHYFSSVTAGADFNPLLIRCGEPVAKTRCRPRIQSY